MSEGFEGGEEHSGKDLVSVPAPAAIPGPLVDLVLDSLPSPHSRRAYGRALEEFFSWYPSNASGEGFTRAVVQRYRAHIAERSLSAASINLHLAALRKLAAEAAANSLIDPGTASAGITSGPVLRPVSKAGLVGEGSISSQAVFETVIRCARLAGLGKVTPHDLRRTFAKLAHQGRAPLEQIQISMGHASIQTTERYLGLKQNLHDAPCDRLGIVGWESGPAHAPVLPYKGKRSLLHSRTADGPFRSERRRRAQVSMRMPL